MTLKGLYAMPAPRISLTPAVLGQLESAIHQRVDALRIKLLQSDEKQSSVDSKLGMLKDLMYSDILRALLGEEANDG